MLIRLVATAACEKQPNAEMALVTWVFTPLALLLCLTGGLRCHLPDFLQSSTNR